MMSDKALVTIPTIGASDLLPGLLDFLMLDPAVKVIDLYVNDPLKLRSVRNIVKSLGTCDTQKINIRRAPERTIYPSWNMGMDKANQLGMKAVILNDDIEFGEIDPITEMLGHWENHDNVAIMGFDSSGTQTEVRHCRGSYRHGGIPGFAFAIDPSVGVRVDPQFQWWYGDDDLFFSVEKAGYQLACCPVPVQHEASTTANRVSWVDDVIKGDAIRWQAKWGDL